jgi:hypothetical protein
MPLMIRVNSPRPRRSSARTARNVTQSVNKWQAGRVDFREGHRVVPVALVPGQVDRLQVDRARAVYPREDRVPVGLRRVAPVFQVPVDRVGREE